MIRLPLRCLALAAAAAVAGCDTFDPFKGCEESGEHVCASGAAGYEPDVRMSLSHTASEVTVEPAAGGGFTARRTYSVTNDFDGVTDAHFSAYTDSGSVSSIASESSVYEIRIALSATAPTEEEARAALGSIDWRHEDLLYADGSLGVRETVDVYSDLERRADIVMLLPQQRSYGIDQHSMEGDVSSTGLHGASLSLDTGVGNVTADGTWDSAHVGTNEGIVTVNADVAELTAEADTGRIDVVIPGTRAADIAAASEDGDIDVSLGRTSSTRFDLEAASTVGAASIAVEGTSPEGLQAPNRAHYRSADYDSSGRKVHVDAAAGVGDVAIHE